MDMIGQSHPSPRPSPREGRGRRTRSALPLSPQRGEGRGEGCDWLSTLARVKHVRGEFQKLFYVCFLALTACTATRHHTAMSKPKQTAKVLDKTVSRRVKANYLLFLPDGYEAKPRARWPVLLFLHGIGERGSDPWKVKIHGPPKIAEQMTNFPFILVSPQCPNGQWWSNEILTALLDEIIAKYKADTNRVYLTGLSMGGFGAWNLALQYPERFAAVAPLCGGGNPYYIQSYNPTRKAALRALPFWVFHGEQDTAVAPEESRRMVDALKKIGCDIKFTLYPGVGHDCWTQTYNNPELYEWLLSHTRAGSCAQK